MEIIISQRIMNPTIVVDLHQLSLGVLGVRVEDVGVDVVCGVLEYQFIAEGVAISLVVV